MHTWHVRSLTRSLTLALTLALALSVPSASCGSTGGRVLPPPEPTSEAPPPAATPDAFRDFSGERVDAGAPFELDGVGRAVRGVEVVVRMDRVRTSTWMAPSGEERTEGVATIFVERGTERATVRVREGDAGEALGVKVEVHEASVAYSDTRLDYLPRAKVTVTAAPYGERSK